MSKTLCQSQFVKQSASIKLIRVLRTLWKKNVTRTARPLRIGSPLINVRGSLLSCSTGCSCSLSVSLILATCLVDLWGAINSWGRPAVGGSESPEQGKFGSRKILAWSQSLGSVCLKSRFLVILCFGVSNFLSLCLKFLKPGSRSLKKSQIYHSIPLLKREDSKVKLNQATRC